MEKFKAGILIGLAVIAFSWTSHPSAQTKRDSAEEYREWEMFGGRENLHYSTLKQINRDNVKQLEVAWTYDTGDAFPGSELQCNPVIVDGVVYATTPKLRVIALDAATGSLRWSFDPNEGRKPPGKLRNRGVTFWAAGADKRIFFVFTNLLSALDAKSGKPIKDFGQAVRVDLREGLGRDIKEISISVSTPGVVYKDLLILGSLVSESLPSSPGHIRAYDARTGKQRWIFHTIPQPGEFGYETWPKDAWKHIGGANKWRG